MNIVNAIDAQIRIFDKMTQKVASFSGLEENEIFQQIDNEMLSVYEQAQKPAPKTIGGDYTKEIYGDSIDPRTLSEDARHALAYYPKAKANCEAAKKRFLEAVEPYKAQFENALAIKEAEYKKIQAEKSRVYEDKRAAEREENLGIIEEIQKFDDSEELGQNLNVKVVVQNGKGKLKALLDLLKLREEGKLNEANEVFENDEFYSGTSEEQFMACVMSSKYSEELLPVCKDNHNSRKSEYETFEELKRRTEELLEGRKRRREGKSETAKQEEVPKEQQLGEEE